MGGNYAFANGPELCRTGRDRILNEALGPDKSAITASLNKVTTTVARLKAESELLASDFNLTQNPPQQPPNKEKYHKKTKATGKTKAQKVEPKKPHSTPKSKGKPKPPFKPAEVSYVHKDIIGNKIVEWHSPKRPLTNTLLRRVNRSKHKKIRQDFADELIRRIVFDHSHFPKIPNQLQTEVNDSELFDWVKIFKDWDRAFLYYYQMKMNGETIESVLPYDKKMEVRRFKRLRRPKYSLARKKTKNKNPENIIHCFKCAIANSIVHEKPLPGIPKRLKKLLTNIDLIKWVQSHPDHTELLEKQRKKIDK